MTDLPCGLPIISPRPGYAMKASDPVNVLGAVLGKAMCSLSSGKARSRYWSRCNKPRRLESSWYDEAQLSHSPTARTLT